MTETEKQQCKIMSLFLKSTCVIGFGILISLISVFTKHCVENLTYYATIFTGFCVGLKTIHMYLDANFFEFLSHKDSNINDLDDFVFKIFKKNNHQKSIEQRIKNTLFQTKIYFVVNIIHWGLFFYN